MEHAAEAKSFELTVLDLRKERGESQAEFGVFLGLNASKVSEIESGLRPVSLRVALKIEELSTVDGTPRIDAALLNDDVARARAACIGGCAANAEAAECHGGDASASHGDADTLADAAASTGQFDNLSRRDGADEMSRDPSTCSGQGVAA